ncbi:17796_t:CDS:1, partial [Dentiscutata erythropus]
IANIFTHNEGFVSKNLIKKQKNKLNIKIDESKIDEIITARIIRNQSSPHYNEAFRRMKRSMNLFVNFKEDKNTQEHVAKIMGPSYRLSASEWTYR